MHRYRTHTCGALRAEDVGATVRLSGWVHRVRDHGGLLFIDLRDHYGLTQIVADPEFAGLRDGRAGARRMVHPRRRRRAPAAPAGDGQPEPADRRDRGFRARDRGAVGSAGAAAAGLRRAGLSGGHAAQIPLPRSPPRVAAPEHHAARRDRREDARADARRRLQRVPDADPDRLLAGGRARLPGAVAAASGKVLRAAAGAAAVQAADHDGGLRPLFPDRALLPRRGSARRPAAGRVLPARRRDELRHAGRRVCGDGAGDPRRVRGVRRRQAGDAGVPAHSLPRGDARTTAPTSRTCATRSRCRR